MGANPLGDGRTVGEAEAASGAEKAVSEGAARRVLIEESKRRHLEHTRAEGDRIRRDWLEGNT